MLNFNDFVQKALNESGVENDTTDIWVKVEGTQYTASVKDVLGRQEQYPFEASYSLEDDYGNDVWHLWYSQYLSK